MSSNQMSIIVVGAGVIGITTAWFLRQQGHTVRVIERRDQAGMETSFANAGHISANLADPWANPSTLRDVSTWLFSNNSPLVFRPKASFHQWSWLLKFLRECPADRYKKNLVHLANLGVYSRTALQDLRAEIGVEYDDRQKGILLFFTEEEKFAGAVSSARELASHGLRREVLNVEQTLDLEPSLMSIRDELKGAIYSRFDETGDAFKFTQALAKKAEDAGVSFEFNTTLKRFLTGSGQIKGVELVDPDGVSRVISADRYVMCLGTSSPKFSRQIGVGLDIYPIKGYSVTLPVRPGSETLSRGLTDAALKMAFSRLGDRVRATAIAEIGGYDLTVDRHRCDQIVENAKRLFGETLDYENASYWAGLRPMTPSSLPVIGKSERYSNLLINAGHGTIGWTQSCGSARAIADIVQGKSPACDFPFIGLH